MEPSVEDNLSPLAEPDWDFDPVPDSELIGCCLWEYARESSSIGMGADIGWCKLREIENRERYRLDPSTKAADDKEAHRLRRRAKSSGFSYDGFLDRFWGSELAAVEVYQTITLRVMTGACAWQQLAAKARELLTRQVSKSDFVRPLSLASVGDVERLWNANRGELDRIRSAPRPENDDSEECASYLPSEPVVLEADSGEAVAGKIAAALTVDFARFNDREILAEFQRWLTARRPKAWRRPLRVFPSSGARGRKQIEYRVALERLGLMRLLHWHPPGEIRSVWPAAWSKYRRKRESFRREVRQASRFFRRLFPFLPANEKPESEERHAVWMKRFAVAFE